MQNILYQTSGKIATITINRPDKMNALNIQTIDELEQAFLKAISDNSVSGIILTGAGKKAFVAGADIAELNQLNVEKATELSAKGHRVFNQIEVSKKPVIAAVNGFALGGGCELAMACHMRLASENARFGQPEVNLGLIPGYAGTQRLPQLIGKAKAIELLLTADMIKAPEALQLGLVNYVLPQEELLPKCVSILEKIASKGPLATQGILDLVNDFYDKKANGFENEIQAFGKLFGSEDFKEGTSAFVEKRKANFTGK